MSVTAKRSRTIWKLAKWTVFLIAVLVVLALVSSVVERSDAPGRVDCAVHLHQDLGPGLLETVYEVTLARKLEKRGLSVQRQVPLPTAHDGHRFEVDWPRRTLSVPRWPLLGVAMTAEKEKQTRRAAQMIGE